MFRDTAEAVGLAVDALGITLIVDRRLAVLAGHRADQDFPHSFALEAELSGQWPWQRGRRSDPTVNAPEEATD